MATERFANLSDGAFVSARQENLETIHKHNVVAERHGLLAELAHEIETGERAGRQVTMREWLEAASAAIGASECPYRRSFSRTWRNRSPGQSGFERQATQGTLTMEAAHTKTRMEAC